MSGRSSVVAVVDGTDAGIAVWWVRAGLPDEMSRLCGAWIVDDGDIVTLDALTFERWVWPTRSGQAALSNAGVQPGRVFDAAATVAGMRASLRRCQDAFDEEQAKRSKSARMKPPR